MRPFRWCRGIADGVSWPFRVGAIVRFADAGRTRETITVIHFRARAQTTLAFLGLLPLAACFVADAGPRELKFGHVGEPGSLFALSADGQFVAFV